MLPPLLGVLLPDINTLHVDRLPIPLDKSGDKTSAAAVDL
jgi:hypothetical protein